MAEAYEVKIKGFRLARSHHCFLGFFFVTNHRSLHNYRKSACWTISRFPFFIKGPIWPILFHYQRPASLGALGLRTLGLPILIVEEQVRRVRRCCSSQ